MRSITSSIGRLVARAVGDKKSPPLRFLCPAGRNDGHGLRALGSRGVVPPQALSRTYQNVSVIVDKSVLQLVGWPVYRLRCKEHR